MNDFHYALRQLRKAPGFTAVAVLSLALGIALVTVQFSFVYGALIKGLPFEGAERIQSIEARNASDTRYTMVSLAHFAALVEHQKSFEHLGATRGRGLDVTGRDGVSRRYPGVECTAGIFEMTGVPALLGRHLQPADNKPGAERVVVLGEEVWQHDYDADPAVIGRSVRVDGQPAVIVGVMPAGFEFPLKEKAWTNLIVDANAARAWTSYIEIVGRLRPDVTLAQARAEFIPLGALIAREGPRRENFGARLTIEPYAARQVGMMSNMLWLLLGIVGAVLILACVNVANLLYARAVRCRHEMSIRLALGGTRGALVRQSIAFSLVLSVIGAVVGVLLAFWTVPVVNAFLTDPQKPYWVALDLDWRVLAATATVTLLVGVVAGLLPALRAARFGNVDGLRDGGHASTAASLGRTTRILTISQLLLATGVLVVALVLGRGVYEAGVDCYPGDASHVLVGATVFQRATPNALGTARTQLLTRAAAFPGVQAAALTTRDPDTRGMPSPVEIRDRPESTAGRAQVPVEWITPGYFGVFGIQPVRGRLFGDADREGAPPVAIVNESFARRFWPGEDPIGGLCRIEDAESEPQWRTVVGIVPDLPVAGIARGRHEPGVYLPLHESSAKRVNLLLRTEGSPLAYVSPVQKLLGELARDQPFQVLLPLDSVIDQRLRLPRLMAALAFAFGITGGVLAAVGVFGVTAFLVEQRWRELGVRIALGATPRQVGSLVIRGGVRQLAIGLAGGLALGIGLIKPVQAIPLFQSIAAMHATDLLAVIGVMVVTVLLACWLPARRATRVNPIDVLRAE